MANESQKLTIVLEGDSKKLQKALKAANQAMTDLDKKGKQSSGKRGGLGMMETAFRRLAAYGAAGIAINGVQRFVKDSIKMAASLEGIERQFKAVTSAGQTSLSELRRATSGTVSDLELMKGAVRASNFNMPLNKLATLFEFAKIRATQTGDSVQYLTDSIVLGIGRKSPLILDNLGITMLQLKEAMGKTGKSMASVNDLMEAAVIVAQKEIDTMKMLGLDMETSSQKADKLTSSVSNLKAALGTAILESGAAEQTGSVIDNLSQTISNSTDAGEGFGKTLLRLANFFVSPQNAAYEYADALEAKNKKLKESQELSKAYRKELEAFAPSIKVGELSLDQFQDISKRISEAYTLPDSKGLDFKGVQLLAQLTEIYNKQKIAKREDTSSTKELLAVIEEYEKKLTSIKNELKVTGNESKSLNSEQTLLVSTLTLLADRGFDATSQFTELSNSLSSVNEQIIKLSQQQALDKFLKTLSQPSIDLSLGDLPKDAKELIGYLHNAKYPKEEDLDRWMTDEHAMGEEVAADPLGLTKQSEQVERFKGVFQGLSQAFMQAAGSGETFGEIMSGVFKRMLAEVTALLGTFLLLNFLTGGSLGTLGDFVKDGGISGGGLGGGLLGAIFGGKGTPTSSVAGAAATNVSGRSVSSVNVNVQGEMRGNDIFLTGQRGKNFINRRLG